MSASFFTKCNQVVQTSYATAGSVTRANVSYATPASLAAIFQDSGTYRDMDALLTYQLEIKACGTKRFDMYDWLMANATSVGKWTEKRKIMRGPEINVPYILARQQSVINSDYWPLKNGWAASAYVALGDSAANPLNGDADASAYMAANASARVIRVQSRPNSGVPALAAYFPPKTSVFAMEKHTDGSASYGAWRVLYAANKADSSICDIIIEQQGDTSESNSTPGASAKEAMLLIGANNVDDFERWCHNRPALNNEKRVPFWLQTTRTALTVDTLYEEWYQRMITSNRYFQEFGDVDMAERNRQLGEMTQREWVNSFFWNQIISDQQTLADWDGSPGLEKIYSIDKSSYGHSNVSGKEMGRRANAVGVFWQLKECGRVKDLMNQQLNLVEFFNDIYDVMRSREGESTRESSSSVIDVWTDRETAYYFWKGMVAYFKNELGSSNVQFPISPVREMKPFGFKYQSYELLHPAGVTLNIITSKFFDDQVSNMRAHDTTALGAGKGSAMRGLWVLDLGAKGIYPGIADSNMQEYRTGELSEMAKIDRDYACVMKVPTERIKLSSVTWTAIVECPSSNLIYTNFRDIVPDHTGVDDTNYDDLTGAEQTGTTTDGLTVQDAAGSL